MILSCKIYVSAAGTLLEQYWSTIGTEGVRFFRYTPDSGPSIDPDYADKIIGYGTGMWYINILT